MNKTVNPTVQRLMELADNYADAPEFPHFRQILEAELTRLLTPLNDEQIATACQSLGFGTIGWFAIARAIEQQHGIGGES